MIRDPKGNPIRLWRVEYNLIAYVVADEDPGSMGDVSIPEFDVVIKADPDAGGRWQCDEVGSMEEVDVNDDRIEVIDGAEPSGYRVRDLLARTAQKGGAA